MSEPQQSSELPNPTEIDRLRDEVRTLQAALDSLKSQRSLTWEDELRKSELLRKMSAVITEMSGIADRIRDNS